MQVGRSDSKGSNMVYRKGERPVQKRVVDYSADHPAAGGIADGDHWMDAWLGQQRTPWDVITRKAGISRERIHALTFDDAMPTDDEINKLAALWWTTPERLRRSIEEAQALA